MPYNTAAIPPRREVTGQAQLPLSRVKKIIALDQDINMCSNAASFVITLATEMFIQYLAEHGHTVVRSERKPRRNIQYRDLANAVSRIEPLEFLVDIVPKTMPYKEAKLKKVPTVSGPSGANGATEHGQTTLDGRRPMVNGMNGLHVADDAAGDERNLQAQLEMESRVPDRMSIGEAVTGNANEMEVGVASGSGREGRGENGRRDMEMELISPEPDSAT